MKTYNTGYVKDIFRKQNPIDSDMKGRFSVLALLVSVEGEARLVFEVRAEHLRHQPGEICFPGGHIEKDESAQTCAVRETSEELGLPEESIRIISPLGYEYTYKGELLHSFVGEVDAETLDPRRINREEVKEIFTVPISFFLEWGPRESYTYQGYYIWGLTARVVKRLVKICLKHKPREGAKKGRREQ